MKDNYEARAQKLIRQLLPFIEESMFDICTIGDAIDEFNCTHNCNILFKNGDARFALIHSDYVIKYDYDDEAVAEIGGCMDEMFVYEQAVEDGFDYLFAKISRYDYNGYSFYIMPRIPQVGKYRSHHAEYYMTEEERNWCKEHRLTDLHSGNFGFRDNKVCIVDYAYIDFREEE